MGYSGGAFIRTWEIALKAGNAYGDNHLTEVNLVKGLDSLHKIAGGISSPLFCWPEKSSAGACIFNEH